MKLTTVKNPRIVVALNDYSGLDQVFLLPEEESHELDGRYTSEDCTIDVKGPFAVLDPEDPQVVKTLASLGFVPPIIPAHRHLIRHALQVGAEIMVDGGGEGSDLDWSRDEAAIIDAAEACDMVILYIHGGKVNGTDWALVVHGNNPDELVADYGVSAWMDAWWETYRAYADRMKDLRK